jgi:hypothetical protein
MMPNVTQLIDAAFDRIVRAYGENVRAALLPEPERVVVCIVTSKGILDNGGFDFLFETDLITDPDYQYTRQSYHLIGARQSSSAFDQAWSQYPGAQLPGSPSERLRIWSSVAKDLRRSIDQLFWQDDVSTLLATYIREHMPK